LADHAPVPEGRRWYLVQCKPREAFRALEHLRNQGYEAFLPVLAREVVRRGRPAALREPLFPHYLFLRLSDVADNWAPLRSTRGVARLVSFGGLPLPVPDDIVTALRLREAGQGAEPEALFVPGQAVEIMAGPLAGLDAVFSARDGAERVVVLLKLMQREQAVDVGLADIRPKA